MEQLNTKTYSRSEIGNICGVSPSSPHFKRNVENILTKWGYSYEYSKKTFTITAKPQTPEERLREVLIRAYKVDAQVNILDFAFFIYFLLEDVDGFASMPWKARSKYLLEWNIQIDERTIRRWTDKLLATTAVIKDKREKTYWMTYSVDGIKYQEELIEGSKSLYWKEYWNCFFKFQKEGEKEIGLAVYKKLHYCVYSCPTYLFGAFDKVQAVRTLVELVREIVETEISSPQNEANLTSFCYEPSHQNDIIKDNIKDNITAGLLRDKVIQGEVCEKAQQVAPFLGTSVSATSCETSVPKPEGKTRRTDIA